MKRSLFLALLTLFTSMSLVGCGSATDTTPLNVLNGDTTPQLSSILQSTGTAYGTATLSSGFTANNPYWVFNATTFNGAYLAPANGYVGRIDLAQLNGVTVTYVTLIHSGHLATRVYGMQVVSVRPGDTVLQGSVIGQYLNSGSVAFQVLWDGVAVCPLSYMSNTFRTTLSASVYYSQLCN